MAAPRELTVVLAETEADRAALARLYPLYLHDLSAFTDHYELDAEARWRPSYLDDMLARRGECRCLLFREGGRAAGFALVGVKPFPHMAPDADFRMCEFFVAQPYRRRGLGRDAARAVLGSFRGAWEVNEVVGNEPALAFWRAVVGELTAGAYVELTGEGELTQRFTVG